MGSYAYADENEIEARIAQFRAELPIAEEKLCPEEWAIFVHLNSWLHDLTVEVRAVQLHIERWRSDIWQKYQLDAHDAITDGGIIKREQVS